MHKAPCLTKVGRIEEMITVVSIEVGIPQALVLLFQRPVMRSFHTIYFQPYHCYRLNATNILLFNLHPPYSNTQTGNSGPGDEESGMFRVRKTGQNAGFERENAKSAIRHGSLLLKPTENRRRMET